MLRGTRTMPSQIALLICTGIIIFLFWLDRERNKCVSKAIWVPFIWMLPSASREYAFWASYLFNIRLPSDSITDGNPFDRAIEIVLIITAIVILTRRRPNWNLLFMRNGWVWLFFVYGAISIVWSDFPLVSLKRWIKALGNVSMVLIILTEERPIESLAAILKRLAFLLLPLSVLLIKYYPELGKSYHQYAGTAWYTGVAGSKNELGVICLLSGIYFSWDLLYKRIGEIRSDQRLGVPVYLITLSMTLWLLHMANSATSTLCMIVACTILIVARVPFIARKPGRIVILMVVSVALLGGMEYLFNIKDTIIHMLGRRPDLTTRVPMWDDLLRLAKNPIVGVGYESFWLGDRRTFMAENWEITCQAHNGYLEMYLNLGCIGVIFVLGWIYSGLRKIHSQMAIDYSSAMLRLCFLLVIVLHSFTEASFFGDSILWLLLFATTMEYDAHCHNGFDRVAV